MSDVLLVFTRYPEPGKCKTRLIPTLGVEQATQVHAGMLRHTLTWVRELRKADGVRVQVQIAGGSPELMRQQFGGDLTFVPQAEGDLGQRLCAAIEASLTGSIDRIVVVGTDCPQLSRQIASAAFERLMTHDVVIAPARDGGYTLVGLRIGHHADCRSSLSIFDSIAWGSAQVLGQTLQRVREGGMSCALLPTLDDVDLPHDLPVWQQAQAEARSVDRNASVSISVIIPTLDEEPCLSRALTSAAKAADAEVIVAAAGRVGRSLELAAKYHSQCVTADRGRAVQMNAGGAIACGEILIFLHADSMLPAGYAEAVAEAMQSMSVVGGAFSLRIDSPRAAARIVERGANFRAKYLSMPYGDQAIFVRRSVFERLGGFPLLPIMEDFEFVRCLRRQGQLVLLSLQVPTSDRRWQRLGYVRTTMINQLMVAGYRVGIAPRRLAQLYRGKQAG